MASKSSMDVDGGASTARTGAGAGAQQPQRPSWRSRLVAYAAATSSSSSTSGGSLSTTYSSGSSHMQSSGDAGLAPPVALSTLLELEEGREKMRRHIMCLVQEFLAAAGDDEATTLVLERCFSDLGISWVLSITTDGNLSARASIFPRRLGDLARSWVVALTVIQLSVYAYLNGSCNQEEGAFSSVPPASEFAQFLQSTFLKMVPFADAVASARVNDPCIEHNLWEAMVPAEEKLQAVIGVRHALFEASLHIHMWYLCPSFQGSTGILDQTMSSLLSEKMAKLDEAIWDTLRTSIMSLTGNHNEADSMDPQILETSSDIHKATRSTVNCIKVICPDNGGLLHRIVSKAASVGKFVPQDNRINHPFISDPFDMLIMEITSCVQENLVRVSQSFPDQSLRFLFLLNNTHFLWQQLHHPSYGLDLFLPELTRKIDDHIQRYLQMSWIPVVSGLHDPTPLCFGRFSSLAKFEAEFQKTYTAQKLWKVADPELRKRLRKAIIGTVIPTYTKYLEDKKITAPRVTQQELEDMLQDLFEG
ncbi:unnamed protein product [Urochloa decumbens]|uniref:Exocyst subunit Exo70 family protein n=1 Tax=Urochloa decumbens TaxID=240449 RepID=A0ABC9BQ07_9POAL